jgi:hypothetical protein
VRQFPAMYRREFLKGMTVVPIAMYPGNKRPSHLRAFLTPERKVVAKAIRRPLEPNAYTFAPLVAPGT